MLACAHACAHATVTPRHWQFKCLDEIEEGRPEREAHRDEDSPFSKTAGKLGDPCHERVVETCAVGKDDVAF